MQHTSHPNKPLNAIFSEYLRTMILVLCAIFAINKDFFGGAPIAIALVVMVIGASLGGVTTWAINPARDIMPRLPHFIMYKVMIKRWIVKEPEKGETISNWKYAWIPFFTPLAARAL